eukprot:m.86581 g.86581  ORF g.86581 m.86581 type:complete len:654 (-) comp8437_c0_seq3:528-2489(-)
MPSPTLVGPRQATPSLCAPTRLRCSRPALWTQRLSRAAAGAASTAAATTRPHVGGVHRTAAVWGNHNNAPLRVLDVGCCFVSGLTGLSRGVGLVSGTRRRRTSSENKEDWLSDLESDGEDGKYIDKTDIEATNYIRLYREACRRHNCVPVSFFERNVMCSHFIMGSHGLGSKGAKAIADCLESNVRIEHLELRDNYIQAAGAAALARKLCENSYITFLDLSRNHVGSVGINTIASCLQKWAVEQLVLSDNNFLDMDATELCTSLSIDTQLQTLVLANNRFADLGAIRFAEMLRVNRCLRMLDLSTNCIGKKGGVALGQAIGFNSTLISLNLSNNGIGDAGAIAFAEGLRHNTTLSELNLDNNNIHDKGAMALAAALASGNSSLTSISLKNNPIGSDGMRALLQALKENKSLRAIDIDGIPLDAECIKLLSELAKSRPGLCIVSNATNEHQEENTSHAARTGGTMLPFNPDWTAEEAWANGYHPDGTPRTDAEWLRHIQSFNPNWTAQEAWKNGFNADGTPRSDSVFLTNRRAKVRFSQHSQTLALAVQAFAELAALEEKDMTEEERRWYLAKRERAMSLMWGAKYPGLKDPMAVLENYVEENRLRMVDLFFAMDKNRDGELQREEIEHAVVALSLPLNEVQLEELMDRFVASL